MAGEKKLTGLVRETERGPPRLQHDVVGLWKGKRSGGEGKSTPLKCIWVLRLLLKVERYREGESRQG